MEVGLDAIPSRNSVFERLYSLSQSKLETPERKGQPSSTKRPWPKVELRLMQKLHQCQAKLRHQRVVQALKAKKACSDKPRIDPTSRRLAGMPSGEDAELARCPPRSIAHSLQLKNKAESRLANGPVKLRVCLKQPTTLAPPTPSQKEPVPLTTSNGIPYETLRLQLPKSLCKEPKTVAQVPKPGELSSSHKYLPLTPSSKTVRFASGINFKVFMTKAKPLVKYDSAASKT